MNKLFTPFIIALVLISGVYVYTQNKQASSETVKNNQTLGELNRFTAGVTNTSVGCSSTASVLLATSTGRQYVAIVNDSANTVYIALGFPAIGSRGIRLNAGGGSYEITQENLYTGQISCIASSTSVVTVSYK